MRYIKLRHEMIQAKYDEPSGKWHLRVRRPNPETGELEEIEDVADVLVTAFGSLTRWRLPDIEGINDYKGELHHSAGFDPLDKTWQEVADAWSDKKVGVIGVVSTRLSIASLAADYAVCARHLGFECAAARSRPSAPRV